MSGDAQTGRVDFARTPLAYPGPPVTRSALLLPNCLHTLTPRASRRLGQARVERCEQCAAKDGLRTVPLNYELLNWNVANIDMRSPVVAVGSNASADVLRGKMERAGIDPIIPLVKGVLHDVRIGYSAHVGRPGFIPAAPARIDGDTAEVVVGWLDRDQLEHMDATEPNYFRRHLDGEEYRLELDGGEMLASFHIYDSKWGLLSDQGAVLTLGTQTEVAAWLGTAGLAPWQNEPAERAAVLLAADEPLRDRLRQEFAGRGLVTPSGIDGPTSANVTYATTMSRWTPAPAVGPRALPCTSTPDGLWRAGQQCVRLNPEDAVDLGVGEHVEVTSALHPADPGLLAFVRTDADQARGTVGVDQVIRNSLGIERAELVNLRPVTVPRNAFADTVIAPPHYVVCRVQAADLAIVEQDVALVSPLTLSLLGIQPGSRIVIEGIPERPSDRVPVVRIKAHEAPQEIVDRRIQFSGGGYESRFPSSRDALGVFPDLPWIFLDAATRSTLGLGTHRMRAVRVRTARLDQALTELREVLLLFILAAVGVGTVIPSVALFVVFLIALGIGTAALARARLRRRLGISGHARRFPPRR